MHYCSAPCNECCPYYPDSPLLLAEYDCCDGCVYWFLEDDFPQLSHT